MYYKLEYNKGQGFRVESDLLAFEVRQLIGDLQQSGGADWFVYPQIGPDRYLFSNRSTYAKFFLQELK